MPFVTPLSVVAIDDNPRLLASIELLLATLGHHVRTAATGEQGVQLVQEQRPDLVICDIDLQGPINGYGVARTLSMAPPQTPIFLAAFSGNSQQQDREQSAAAGFHRHVAKPANINDIEMLIAEARLYCVRNARVAPHTTSG